jgi:DNA-binding response OmpR family regulator
MTKILIAEDEKDIRDLITFTLTFSGYQVVPCADGAEAVETAPREMPDLIMMDVRMPRMTGYEACQQLKANPAVQNIPVVFLSAKGQDAEIQTGLNMGASEYLLKPFAPMELVERVKQILEKYSK